MANYLYKHRIMTDLTNCFGFNASQEASDKSDFDTNYKSSTIKVDDLELLDTVFIIEKSYADFKTLIDGTTITWGDVKREDGWNFYDLYLITDTLL